MKLTYETIKQITFGSVRIEEENGNISFYRFTKEQEELYRITNEGFYNKTFSTAGIKLAFRTDSENIFLKIHTSPSTTRKYFSVDVFADDKPVGYLDNFSDTELPRNYTTIELPLGEFSKSFHLCKGEKDVRIYLPWSVRTVIREISVDDGAFVIPAGSKRKLLAFGDSITHGYDAKRPSDMYITRLADALCAEQFNKAIGGERFFPRLAQAREDFVPDLITVAYGTNDWNTRTEGLFRSKCRNFYKTLSEAYPDSRIFAITPIWRKDMHEERSFGLFENVEKDITELTADLENVTVISGFDLVPRDERFFADLRLHPNDEGFELYFERLLDKMKEHF